MAKPRDRFGPDVGLQLCMAIVLLLVAVLTLAFVVGLVALTVLVDRGWSLTVLFVVLALIGLKASTGPRRLRHRGRDVTHRDRERLRAIVERLCVVADMPEPRASVRESPLVQSWTLAVPWAEPRVYVTTALVDRLDDRELAAVVAHELSHIAHRDALVMTVAAAPGIAILRGLRQAWREGRRQDPFRAYFAIPFGLMFAIPALPYALLARILSRFRERAADEGAARLTGSPAAVSAALVALSDELAARRRTDLRAPAPAVLNILPVKPARGIARLWATHPPLDARLAALERMEGRLQVPTARTSAR